MPIRTARALAAAGFLGSILALAIYFWCLARHNPDINFLSSHARAEWILFPAAPAGGTHPTAEARATFRRSFVLQNPSQSATLSIRAMKRWGLSVNGALAGSKSTYDERWKEPTALNVAATLHAGTNEIAVTVWNTNGPPALWLALEVDGQRLDSDSNWRVQFWDSTEYAAALATEPPSIRPGNRMFMTETPIAGLGRHWIFFAGATIVSAFVLSALRQLQKRKPGFFDSDYFALYAVALSALLWAGLYGNNLRALSIGDGFDGLEHLNYIERVQSRPGLPLANEGWQMYQPPLYYMASAIVEDVFNPGTRPGKATAARILNFGVGIAHFTLIFLSLRLIFPGHTGMQAFGLLLAVLIPAHLCISQYVTNESLAAMLVTASLFLCLRIVVTGRNSWQMYLAVGICFGMALLTKVTAVLAAPFVTVALCDPAIFRKPAPLPSWLAKTGAAAAACLVICGWHYYRMWSHFGSPLAGNWNASVWPPWWMDPGFRTWSYFFRFGACLTHPWFSGFNGFADGLYSTMWGDGLLGGRVAIEFRPTWNYELMAAGYLLALGPSIVIAMGAISAIKNFLQQPSRLWLMLVGVPLVTLSALIYMNLKVPNCGEAKAFYGLIALLPMCAFGALGYEALKRLGKTMFTIALIIFGVWAINSYATFWIRTNTADSRAHMALAATLEGNEADMIKRYTEAMERAPQDVKLKALFAMGLSSPNRTNEISSLAARALKDPLPDAGSHFALAEILGLDRQYQAAINEARKSLDTAPDNSVPWVAISEWQIHLGHYSEAILTGQQGQRANPLSASLNLNTGLAFAKLGDDTNAADHFRIASQLQPDWPEASDRLGLSLMTLQRFDEATNAFVQAVRLAPQESIFRFHYAQALAGLGDGAGEIAQYREILRINHKFVPAIESLAWRLATSPNPDLLDGGDATQLASQACQLGDPNEPRFTETLAAAYARAGMFEEAAKTIQKAIALAQHASQTDAAAFDQKLLKLYQSGQAWIDDTPRKPVISSDEAIGEKR